MPAGIFSLKRYFASPTESAIGARSWKEANP
jgi:hypothetical protein